MPRAIWDRLLAFLAEGRTGQVELHIHEGRVRDAWVRERVTSEETRRKSERVLESESS